MIKINNVEVYSSSDSVRITEPNKELFVSHHDGNSWKSVGTAIFKKIDSNSLLADFTFNVQLDDIEFIPVLNLSEDYKAIGITLIKPGITDIKKKKVSDYPIVTIS